MKILVLNAGSSTLKYGLYERDELVCAGQVEHLAVEVAVGHIFEQITSKLKGETIAAVGHRIVHGGDFALSVVIDAAVEKTIEDLCELAPLHNPQGLAVFRAARQHFPNTVHVAVFDTAFHQTMPRHAYDYAIPPSLIEGGRLRRYGFHGISFRSVMLRFAELHRKLPEEFRLIICHLGNGSSVCAVNQGQSVDTSMGFTPLEGLVMGTRSGDVDASAILHLIARRGAGAASLQDELNHRSGLLGVSGVSSDMREVLNAADSGNERAGLAVDMFCYRVKKYIGAYLAAMNGADALIFTGGIGENSAAIRAAICGGLDHLGIALNLARNAEAATDARRIGDSRIPVWVIPTEEDLLIARDTVALAEQGA